MSRAWKRLIVAANLLAAVSLLVSVLLWRDAAAQRANLSRSDQHQRVAIHRIENLENPTAKAIRREVNGIARSLDRKTARALLDRLLTQTRGGHSLSTRRIVVTRRVVVTQRLQPITIVRAGQRGPRGPTGPKGDRGERGLPGVQGQPAPPPSQAEVRRLVCQVAPIACQ